MSNKDLSKPFVSCIMPTYNRRAFISHAIRYFTRQDYPNKELIIIDDGDVEIADLIPQTGDIKYYKLPQKISIGAKLNLACTYSKGDIIANWNDDDWYASRRLTYQVEALQDKRIGICGINKLLYYDIRNGETFKYIYPDDQRIWLAGSSMCYTRELWNSNRFDDINIGEDGLFVWRITPDRIKLLEDSSISVHMIHDANVCPKKTSGQWWHPHPVNEIKEIMKEDWINYKVTNE